LGNDTTQQTQQTQVGPPRQLVTDLLRTCYGETDVMDSGLISDISIIARRRLLQRLVSRISCRVTSRSSRLVLHARRRQQPTQADIIRSRPSGQITWSMSRDRCRPVAPQSVRSPDRRIVNSPVTGSEVCGTIRVRTKIRSN